MMRETHTFPLYAIRRVSGGAFGDAAGFNFGSGDDLTGTRKFQVGDDVRKINWFRSELLTTSEHDFELNVFLEPETIAGLIVTDRRFVMANMSDTRMGSVLQKHDSMVEAGSQIVDSIVSRRGSVGYYDVAKGEFFVRPANAETEPEKIIERYLPYPKFEARVGQTATLLRELSGREGVFLFVLSDFTDDTLLDLGLWYDLMSSGYDPVPVVIQDPVWERTFPEMAAGIPLPFRNPITGQIEKKRYPKKGDLSASVQRFENEQRLENIRETFRTIGLDWVEVTSADPLVINAAFRSWADTRRRFEQ